MSGNFCFELPVTEVIKKRSSVRTYQPLSLSPQLRSTLEEYARSLKGPFQTGVRFVYFNEDTFLEKAGGRVGTYGFIRGARDYIAGIVERGAYDLEQLGYVFEKLILYATSLGLGTCWLGGTFKRSQFVKATELKGSEMLPAVTTVGYPSEKKRLMERAMKLTVGSRNRKPWDKLFFHQGFDFPLREEEAVPYQAPLEMVRLAPSASNKQPWRIVKDSPLWHFYMSYSPLVNKTVGFDIQRLDMGIAMCHFELAALEEGLAGSWVADVDSSPVLKEQGLYYIISWQDQG